MNKASFPDSTPQFYIIHGVIKSWRVESGSEAKDEQGLIFVDGTVKPYNTFKAPLMDVSQCRIPWTSSTTGLLVSLYGSLGGACMNLSEALCHSQTEKSRWKVRGKPL